MSYCKTDVLGLLKGDTKALEGRVIEFLVYMRQEQKSIVWYYQHKVYSY